MASHPGTTLDAVNVSQLAVRMPQAAAAPQRALTNAGATSPASIVADQARGLLRKLLSSEHATQRSFSFFAALRRVECRFRSLPRLGEAAGPAHEPVRLAQDPSLGFRASALASISEGKNGLPARVSVGFFGAFGPHGPLPTHLTEYALERQLHHGDGTLVGFFDIFHHRLLCLLYRAWASAQPTVQQDRPETDHFARHLGALVGQRTALGPRPLEPLDYACLYTALHFAGQTRHAEGLKKVLQACFGVAVEVDEFVGRWLRIPDQSCWRLPASEPGALATHGAIGVLGDSSRIGTEVWDQQSTFGIVIGPLGRADYERFLPGSPDLARLLELVERYAGPELGWSLRLVLREPERRAAVLGQVGLVGVTTHLGSGSGDGQCAAAFDDLVLDPSLLST